jgi:hypothetical protein
MSDTTEETPPTIVVKKPFPEDRAIKLALAREKALEVRRKNSLAKKQAEVQRITAQMTQEPEQEHPPPPPPKIKRAKKQQMVVVEQSSDDSEDFQSTENIVFVKRVRKKPPPQTPPPPPRQPEPRPSLQELQHRQYYNEMFSGRFPMNRRR